MSIEAKAKELIQNISNILNYYAEKGCEDGIIRNLSKKEILEIIEDCEENVASWIRMIVNDYEFGDNIALDTMLSRLKILASSVSELLKLKW